MTRSSSSRGQGNRGCDIIDTFIVCEEDVSMAPYKFLEGGTIQRINDHMLCWDGHDLHIERWQGAGRVQAGAGLLHDLMCIYYHLSSI